jgi:hypothetical protein
MVGRCSDAGWLIRRRTFHDICGNWIDHGV